MISAFDLDQTLFTDNSSYRYGLYLYKKKLIPLSSLLFIVGCNLRFKLGLLSIPRLHDEAFRRLFKGRKQATIAGHVEQFLDLFFDQLIYLPAYQKLLEAKKSGHTTVILSSSPDFLVGPIAKRFKVDYWAATQYAVDKDLCFCKISHLMLGDDKANYMNQLLKKLNFSSHVLSAYSDSYVDLPFLLVAANPVGVNPCHKLRAICQQKKWPII